MAACEVLGVVLICSSKGLEDYTCKSSFKSSHYLNTFTVHSYDLKPFRFQHRPNRQVLTMVWQVFSCCFKSWSLIFRVLRLAVWLPVYCLGREMNCQSFHFVFPVLMTFIHGSQSQLPSVFMQIQELGRVRRPPGLLWFRIGLTHRLPQGHPEPRPHWRTTAAFCIFQN